MKVEDLYSLHNQIVLTLRHIEMLSISSVIFNVMVHLLFTLLKKLGLEVLSWFITDGCIL